MAVFGELRRFPLSAICFETSLKYWAKIIKNTNALTHKYFYEAYNMLNNNNVKNCLDKVGLIYLWENPSISDADMRTIKQIVRDVFIQTWLEYINQSIKMEYYRSFKKNFELESYLNNISIDKYRKQMKRFRIYNALIL